MPQHRFDLCCCSGREQGKGVEKVFRQVLLSEWYRSRTSRTENQTPTGSKDTPVIYVVSNMGVTGEYKQECAVFGED